MKNGSTFKQLKLQKHQISGLSISFISSGTNLNVYPEKEIQKRRRKKKSIIIHTMQIINI